MAAGVPALLVFVFQMGDAFRPFIKIKRASSSASSADAMTALMIYERFRTAPLFFGFLGIAAEEEVASGPAACVLLSEVGHVAMHNQDHVTCSVGYYRVTVAYCIVQKSVCAPESVHYWRRLVGRNGAEWCEHSWGDRPAII